MELEVLAVPKKMKIVEGVSVFDDGGETEKDRSGRERSEENEVPIYPRAFALAGLFGTMFSATLISFQKWDSLTKMDVMLMFSVALVVPALGYLFFVFLKRL